MKLLDTILLYTSAGLLVIGIYEIISGSFMKNHSYWIFTLMISCLFWYGYRKNQSKLDREEFFKKPQDNKASENKQTKNLKDSKSMNKKTKK
jgi:hypothetical protein